jgi:putative RecB family exonuclease
MTVATAVASSTAPPSRGVDYVRPPNRVAEQITGRPYLSHTQLSTMRTCPKRFEFQYVKRLRADFVPSSLVFGGAIHHALELYYQAKLEGLPITIDGLRAAYSNAFCGKKGEDGADVPIRFNKNETEDSLNALAHRILASFLQSPLSSPKGVILGIEEELRVELDVELPDLLAKVDLVTETEHRFQDQSQPMD